MGTCNDRRHPLMQRELELLRTLEEKLRDRRAYEPRHSSEDHSCVECEALDELKQLRKQSENQTKVESIEARRAELLRKHKETCEGCCPSCGDHCPEIGGTSCGGHGHYGGNS